MLHAIRALTVNTSIRYLSFFRGCYDQVTDCKRIRSVFYNLLERSNFSLTCITLPTREYYDDGLSSICMLLQRNIMNLKNRYATLFNILLPCINDYNEDEEYYQQKKFRLK